jgi:peptidoglycan/LPS O-acetylase OafA/YrhL
MFINNKNIEQLGFIRAVAAIGVVTTHAKFALWSGGKAYIAQYPMSTWSAWEYLTFVLDLISSLGENRVYLFFILSGFFITHSTRHGFYFRIYFGRRLLRIYPLFLISSLLAGVVLYLTLTYINPTLLTANLREYNVRLLTSYHTLTWNSFLRTLSFRVEGEYFGFSPHYWSLKQEVIFYLLFPCYRLLHLWGKLGLLSVGILLVVYTDSSWVLHQLFFLVGILLYQLFARGVRLPVTLPVWSYCIICGGLYLGIYLLSKTGHIYWASSLTICLAFVAIECLLTKTIQIPRVIDQLNTISYSLYLNHMWILLLYYAVLSRVSGEVFFYSRWPYYMGVIVAIMGSYLVHYVVQRPMLAYLRRSYHEPKLTRLLPEPVNSQPFLSASVLPKQQVSI